MYIGEIATSGVSLNLKKILSTVSCGKSVYSS